MTDSGPLGDADEARLAEAEKAPSDAQADWIMEVVLDALARPNLSEAVDKRARRAVYALARVGPWRRRAVVEWLAELATGPHQGAWGSTAVATLLDHAKDPTCAPRLLELAADTRLDWPAQVALARAVGAPGLPRLAEVLPGRSWGSLGLLADVQGTLVSLPSDAEPDPLAVLERVYGELSWLQRARLVDRLEGTAPADPGRLAALLVRVARRSDPTTRRAVAAALTRLAHPVGRPWLQAALADPDADVRRLAVAGVARCPEGSTTEVPETTVDLPPFPVSHPGWAALPSPHRSVPWLFVLERLVRAAGGMTWLPWALGTLSLVGLVLSPLHSGARMGLTFATIWMLVALPVGVVLAHAQRRFVRLAQATLGDVSAPRRREHRKRVRGSTITTVTYEHPIRYLKADGRLDRVVWSFERGLAPANDEPVLTWAEGGQPAIPLRGFDGLRVDRRGRLRFRWGLRSTPAALAPLVCLVAGVVLALR